MKTASQTQLLSDIIVADFPELSLFSVWDKERWEVRREGEKSREAVSFREEEEEEEKSHLDLTFISGADPLSGVNSLRSWLWNRERLYACSLQCSSYKIRFHFSRGLREWLERHILSYLQSNLGLVPYIFYVKWSQCWWWYNLTARIKYWTNMIDSKSHKESHCYVLRTYESSQMCLVSKFAADITSLSW